MRDPAYAAFSALDPFFDIVRQGLAGLVDGDHYFDTIAPDAVFEFRYRFPGWPTKLVGREALMALYAVTERVWRCMAQTRSW
jgi:ketosteroid isomerase-like protein